jgi:hypothetical protein
LSFVPPPAPLHSQRHRLHGGFLRQARVGTAQGTPLVVIGRLSRHLGHGATSAEQDATAILTPVTTRLGDFVPSSNCPPQLRHDDERVQEPNDVGHAHDDGFVMTLTVAVGAVKEEPNDTVGEEEYHDRLEGALVVLATGGVSTVGHFHSSQDLNKEVKTDRCST